MRAEALLCEFSTLLKRKGYIDRATYDAFIKLVREVAIKHESETFGPCWILRVPPRRGLLYRMY